MDTKTGLVNTRSLKSCLATGFLVFPKSHPLLFEFCISDSTHIRHLSTKAPIFHGMAELTSGKRPGGEHNLKPLEPSSKAPTRWHRVSAEVVFPGLTSISYPPSTSARSFRLLNLPQEILDMIYRHMIQAGYVNILQACSAVYSAAARYVHSDGVLRLPPSKWDWHQCANLASNQLMDTAQHIEVKPDMMTDIMSRHCLPGPDLKLLSRLINFRVPKETLKICFEIDSYPSPRRSTRNELAEFFETFVESSNFKTVTVCSALGARVYHSATSLSEHKLLKAMDELIEDFTEVYLVPHLGPSTWQRSSSQRSGYLEFHPRMFGINGYRSLRL